MLSKFYYSMHTTLFRKIGRHCYLIYFRLRRRERIVSFKTICNIVNILQLVTNSLKLTLNTCKSVSSGCPYLCLWLI